MKFYSFGWRSHLSYVNARKGYQQLSRLFLVHPSNETVRYLFCHTHPAALAAQWAIKAQKIAKSNVTLSIYKIIFLIYFWNKATLNHPAKKRRKNVEKCNSLLKFFGSLCVIAATLYVFSKIKLTNPFYFLRRQIFNSISRLNSPFQVSAPANRQNVDK